MSFLKTKPGCVNCRAGHYKCDDEQIVCSRCQAKGLECIRAQNIRFKHSSNPSVTNVKGSGLRRCDYNFTKDQVWCKTSHQLHFIDETQGLVDTYEEDDDLEVQFDARSDDNDAATSPPRQSPPVRPPSFAFPLAILGGDSSLDDLDNHDHDDHHSRPNRTGFGFHVDDSDAAFAPPVQSAFLAVSPTNSTRVNTPSSFNAIRTSPTAQSTNIDPEGVNQLTPTISNGSLNAIASPFTLNLARLYTDGSPWPLPRREEAVLMRHFVEHLSICMDICDPDRHFALVVPHRASMCPTLLNAIFACSARHLSRLGDLDPSIAEKYHQECLKHLIPMLNDGAALMDENLLAATVILRFFEEVQVADGEDHEHESHLLGSHIFITAQESSTITGGLRQAAFWVGLRQEIFFAYLKQRSIIPALTHCNIDRSFEPANDYTWANRIIVHCADVIRYCYGDGSQGTSAYTELVKYSEDWMALKPLSFSPMYYKEADEWNIFPEIWLLGDAVATGMQHYYLARILLTAQNPQLPRLGPASKIPLRSMEEEIKSYVRIICAMALSNPRAPPNFASAMLAVTCVGDRFTDKREQEALLNILDRSGEVHAGLSERAQNHLKEVWDRASQ